MIINILNNENTVNMMGKGSNYACTLKATGQVCENQNIAKININHNFHRLLSHEASLNWSQSD